MPILPVLLAIQILLTGFLLNTSPNSRQALFLKQAAKHVLGVSIIADDATAPDQTQLPDQSSSDQNSSPQTPFDSNLSSPTSSSDNQSPSSAPSQDNSSSPNPESTLTPDSSTISTPVPAGESQGATTLSESPTGVEQPSPQPETQNEHVVLDENQKQAQAALETVVSSQDVVSGPAEHIDQKVKQMSETQDQKLEQAKTPDEKATLSVDFAKESIKEVEQSLRHDDLATTIFVAQRISDQIGTAILNVQDSKSSKPLQNLSGFCKQADFIFRTQQLAVPDEAAQDFEIVRGKCLDITK